MKLVETVIGRLLLELRDLPLVGELPAGDVYFARLYPDGRMMYLPASANKSEPISAMDSPLHPAVALRYTGWWDDFSKQKQDVIQQLVDAGLKHIVDKPLERWDLDTTMSDSFRRRHPELWSDPDNPPTTAKYVKTSPELGYSPQTSILRVDRAKKLIDLDVHYEEIQTRRPGKSRDGKAYVIPSADVSFDEKSLNLQKVLDHLTKVDPGVTPDFKIVGSEKFRGKTIADVLEQPREVEAALTGRDPVAMYHGTSSNRWKDIQRKGLQPGRVGEAYVDLVPGYSDKNVYLSFSHAEAENYATRQAIKDGGKAIVLRVTVPDYTKLRPDEDKMTTVELSKPYRASKVGLKSDTEQEFTSLHPRTYYDWLDAGNVEISDPESLKAEMEAGVASQVKRSLRSGTAAYKGFIPPKFISPSLEYAKQAFRTPELEGGPGKWEFMDTRAEVQAGAKRFDEQALRKIVRSARNEFPKVLGYVKPDSSFFTLSQWEDFVLEMLRLQRSGQDTRGGGASLDASVINLLHKYFGFQLDVEVNRYDLLTTKNVLDFVEDFVNHRFWSFERDFGHYFPDINKLRFAYFYSRGELEPYVLLDDEYTTQLYGSTNNPKELYHYTTQEGAARIDRSIRSGEAFDISCFTVAARPFFRKESNVVLKLLGNVRAGFRSDVKSYAVSSGRRCCNLLRLEYPGRDKNNICYELDSCDGEVRTSLWNEYIATPVKILEAKGVTRESTPAALRKIVRSVLREDFEGFQKRVSDLSSYDTISGDFPEIEDWEDAQKQKVVSGKQIKRAFAQEADHNFMNSLTKVHWTGHPYSVLSFLKNANHRDETSTTAYLPGEPISPEKGLHGRTRRKFGGGDGGQVGIEIQGRVTLAHADQDELYTGSWHQSGDNIKFSGVVRRPAKFKARDEQRGWVLDRESYDAYVTPGKVNEFVVDNWKPIAVRVPASTLKDLRTSWEETGGLAQTFKAYQKLFDFVQEAGIPVLDENGRDLTAQLLAIGAPE